MGTSFFVARWQSMNRFGRSKVPKNDRGFTLPELLISLAIASLLAATAAISMLSQRTKAQYAAVTLTLDAVAKEAIAYHHEKGEFPPDTNPGIAPPQLPSFYLNHIWGERRDWDNFCENGVQWAKVGSYGMDNQRDDDHTEPGGRVGELVKTGDDLFKVVAIKPCP